VFDPPADAAVAVRLADVNAAVVVDRVLHALLDAAQDDPVAVFAELAKVASHTTGTPGAGKGR
jgi:hypothetical protein